MQSYKLLKNRPFRFRLGSVLIFHRSYGTEFLTVFHTTLQTRNLNNEMASEPAVQTPVG